MKAAGRIPLILVAGTALLLLAVQFDLAPVLGDEGVLAMDALRISRGEVPQRDFFQFIPPMAALVQALFFKLFSPSVFSLRLVGLIYGVVIFALSCILFRKFMKTELFLALSLSLVVPFGVGGWLFGSHHWLCAILQLGAAILVLEGLEKGSRAIMAAAGVLSGLAAFTLQDQGAYFVLGLFVASLFLPVEERKLTLIAAGSAVLAFAAAALPFAILASPGKLFSDWVAFPLLNYKEAGGNQFTAANIMEKFSAQWNLGIIRRAPVYSLGSAVSSSLLYFAPVLSIVSLILLWLKKEMPRTRLMVLTVMTAAFLLGACHRLALTNLSWAFPVLLPFYISLEEFSEVGQKWRRALSLVAASLLLASALGFSIARINLCLKSERLHRVSSLAGSYRTFNPYEAESFQKICDEINLRVPLGAPVFCVGYSPLVNFMTLRDNPTAYNFMIPGGYYSKEQVGEWLASIEKTGAEWGLVEKSQVATESAGKLLPWFDIVYENDRFILLMRSRKGK